MLAGSKLDPGPGPCGCRETPHPWAAVGVRWLIDEQGMSMGNTLMKVGVGAGQSLCQGALMGV